VTLVWWVVLISVAPPALLGVCVCQQERLARILIRWRNKFPGEPDQAGWQAKVNFERKEP